MIAEVGQRVQENDIERDTSDGNPEFTTPLETPNPETPEDMTSRKPLREAKYVCGSLLREWKELYGDSVVVSFPIEREEIQNWEELEGLW
jgi:hypothetical protein